MISRRVLLVGGTVTLAGCTIGQDVVRLPWEPPPALPVTAVPELPGQLAQATALAERLVANAAAWKLTDRQRASLEWFGDAVELHAQVLASDDPARRQRVASALPAVSVPATSGAAATYRRLTAALTRLRGEHRARALAASGLAALLWAGLAAFSGTMAVALPGGPAARGDDDTGLTPDLGEGAAARVRELTAQAIYSYELALAAPTLSVARRDGLRNRLAAWRTLERSLDTAGVPDVPPALGYDLRPATDAAGARLLAAQAERAALPILGRWVATTTSGTQRRLGVDALIAAHTSAVGHGAPALRWPGWPA